MTEDRFAALVSRLQAEAEASPRGYRLRVAGLAALGFGYVFGVLALLLAALGGVIWGMAQGTGRAGLRRIGSALALLAYTIVRAMWIRFERIEGHEITQRDAPGLFAEVEAVRKRMRAPRVHRVLLERDMNAAVLQRPRLGVLGWQENTLLVGLPLLQALSPDQARAVLAHEFGHLSGGHSRFAGFIYRVRATWTRLLAKLEQDDHWSTFVFRPFFRWYAPYFDAYSFVLARANEYAADGAAAEIASPQAMGDALVSLDLKDTFLQHRFWRWVGEQAEVRPEPDVRPYARMAAVLPKSPELQDAEHWLPQYLRRETSLANTHPCLRDRLAALGIEARIPAAVERSAADAWLGDDHAGLAAVLDAEWSESQGESWRRYHAEVQAKEARLGELAERAKDGPLPAEDAWEQAWLVEERRTPAEALPLYLAYAERYPDQAGARYHAGRLLLETGDAGGIPHLEAAMEMADDGIVPGCELIADFLEAQGRADAAVPYRERRDAHQQQLDAIEAERNSLPFDLEYLPHGADPEDVAQLSEDLKTFPDVKAAWLMRRPLTLSEEPLYVLAVLRRRFTGNPRTWLEYQKDPKPDDLALQARIAEHVRCPGQTKILVLNHRGREAREIWTRVPGTQLLP